MRDRSRSLDAPKVVLGIAALRQGLLDVVANSMLGSILSNLLLVLGKPAQLAWAVGMPIARAGTQCHALLGSAHSAVSTSDFA
jgi:hypothetical protein